MDENLNPIDEIPETPEEPEQEPVTPKSLLFDLTEIIASVTVIVMILFSFVARMNIVEGISMEKTLHGGDALLVSDLFYEPTAGDIVVVHKVTAASYSDPLVKRIIATEGQVVDINFLTWTLTVDGEVVEEDYRFLDRNYSTLKADYSFPVTVPEGHVFVLGDNRNCSADSRTSQIFMVDERCVVGKAILRLSPDFTIFKNPYND